MAEDKKEKKNAMAEMFNWEQRIITEMEAPHKWNEAWASFYAKDVPVEYADKIDFLEKQMKRYRFPDTPFSLSPFYIYFLCTIS